MDPITFFVPLVAAFGSTVGLIITSCCLCQLRRRVRDLETRPIPVHGHVAIPVPPEYISMVGDLEFGRRYQPPTPLPSAPPAWHPPPPPQDPRPL